MNHLFSSRHGRSIAIVVMSVILFAGAIAIFFADSDDQSAQDHPVRAVSSAPLRIMPLGDSITEGQSVPGSYRIELATLFTADHRPFDFVGSQSNGPPGLTDHDHEGHPGWCLANCANNLDDHLAEWLTTYRPDVVLLDAGTNDLLTGASKQEAVDRLRTVVDHIYRMLPDAHLYIAQIHGAGTFNQGVVEVASQAGSRGHFAVVVNMDNTGGFAESDYLDGIHPSARGADLMGRMWYAAMRENGF